MKIMFSINFLDLVSPSPVDMIKYIIEENIVIVAILVIVIIIAVIQVIKSLSRNKYDINDELEDIPLMSEMQENFEIPQNKEDL